MEESATLRVRPGSTSPDRATHALLVVMIIGLLLPLGGAGLISCSEASEPQDPCHGLDCSLRGRCVVRNQRPRCLCDPGYTAMGLQCIRDVCAALYCGRGECAVTQQGVAKCRCEAGWAGEDCLQCAPFYVADGGECVSERPCEASPCIHGLCRMDEESRGPVCDCHPGYTGDRCDRCAQGYVPSGLLCVEEANSQQKQVTDTSLAAGGWRGGTSNHLDNERLFGAGELPWDP